MRNTKKPSNVSENLVKPTLQSLTPRDALAVELMLETIRNRGKLGADVVGELVTVANEAAALLGWSKRAKTPKQEASEILDGYKDDGTPDVAE